MKFSKLYFALFALFVLAFLHCSKDTDVFVPDKDPGDQRTTTVIGYIVGENEGYIAGATITANGKTTVTNSDGFFILKEVDIKEKLKVMVKKEGYFEGCRTIFYRSGKQNDIRVSLLKKNFNQSFQSQSGATVPGNGLTITFEPNSIVTETGGSYLGTVRVATTYLNPKEPQIASTMPGDLVGLNSSNQLRYLDSYGMIGVELQGTNGQKLQIKTGSTATISVRVPNALLASAPKTIPLWSFDYEIGLWKEEGAATLENGSYVGKVSHFSFWNCDAPFPLVHIKGTVKSTSLFPCMVIISSKGTATDTGGPSRPGFTNIDGVFEGKIPKGRKLTLKISGPNCFTSIFYEKEIGPFEQDVDLGDITINPTNDLLSVEGTAKDCNGNNLKNGIVSLYSKTSNAYSYVLSDQEGKFTLSVINCSSDRYYLKAHDAENLKTSAEIEIIQKSGTVTLGEVGICQLQDEFIKIKSINPTTNFDRTFISELRVIDNFLDTLEISGLSNTKESVNFKVILTGNNTGSFGFFTYNSSSINNGFYFINQNLKPTVNTVKLEKYPVSAGGYYIGQYTVKGLNKEGTTEIIDIEGSFRIKKK
jgi:hypothetical protein